MSFLIVVACCVLGGVLGGIVGNDGDAALGFFGGIAFGVVLARLRNLSVRVDALTRELAGLASPPSVETPSAPPTASPSHTPMRDAATSAAAATPASSAVAATGAGAAAIATNATASAITGESVTHDAAPIDTPPPLPPRARTPAAPKAPSPDPVGKAVTWIKRWFTEGNVPVKVGMPVLFAGVAALLKYASDEGWLTLPIELRLAGIALAATAALAFGWRERERRRGFGLALQGGAIGVLLLTVFAAFRLYHLLPASAAFALLLVLVAGAGVLAVLQDALALAVLGILAGFAAPILISTGNGNHVVLFSYYALLNLAIFAIAWRKPWRALNLLGFFFTYAIATAWGVLSYRASLFASTEPFVLIHFAIYLAIPILYARRQGTSKRDAIDGTLVFGNPLVAFALQAALLDGERVSLAYSALALAAIYALLAWRLLPVRRVLGESFAVLGVGFATLAVPLALSARTSACTFALEGAALVWLGRRQARRLPQISGLALQALAAGAFVLALAFTGDGGALPIANGVFAGALLIAFAAFASAWLYHRDDAQPQLAALLHLWGLAWWLGAGLHEIERFVPTAQQLPAVLALAALTAALSALAHARIRASALAWTSAVALASGIVITVQFADSGAKPLAAWGLVAFAAYAVGGFLALRVLKDATDTVVRVAHLGWLWTWTLAVALTLRGLAIDAHLGAGWIAALMLLPVLVTWAIALLRPAWITPPLGARFEACRGWLLATQAIVATIAFAGLLFHDGASAPLPFLPLLNPVELAQLGALACFARWFGDRGLPTDLAQRRVPLLASAGFAFVTAATLRAAHHLGGVLWDENLWDSNLAQTSLTVVWSVLGVMGWVFGSRRGHRLLWLAGAVLMAVVLAKLLLVDRSHLGNLFGIASFIAYGLLCTAIGYFAPAPPRANAQEASA